MDSKKYFVSRNALLAWINGTLGLALTKIGQVREREGGREGGRGGVEGGARMERTCRGVRDGAARRAAAVSLP